GATHPPSGRGHPATPAGPNPPPAPASTKPPAEAPPVKPPADAAAVKAAALGERVIRQAGQEQQPSNSSEPNPFHALPPCPPPFTCIPASRRSGVREGRWRNRHLTRERFASRRAASPCRASV